MSMVELERAEIANQAYKAELGLFKDCVLRTQSLNKKKNPRRRFCIIKIKTLFQSIHALFSRKKRELIQQLSLFLKSKRDRLVDKFCELITTTPQNPKVQSKGQEIRSFWYNSHTIDLDMRELVIYEMLADYLALQPINLYPLTFYWLSPLYYKTGIDITVDYLASLRSPVLVQIYVVAALAVYEIDVSSNSTLRSLGKIEAELHSAAFHNRVTESSIRYFLSGICPLLGYNLSVHEQRHITKQVMEGCCLKPLTVFLAGIKVHRGGVMRTNQIAPLKAIFIAFFSVALACWLATSIGPLLSSVGDNLRHQ